MQEVQKCKGQSVFQGAFLGISQMFDVCAAAKKHSETKTSDKFEHHFDVQPPGGARSPSSAPAPSLQGLKLQLSPTASQSRLINSESLHTRFAGRFKRHALTRPVHVPAWGPVRNAACTGAGDGSPPPAAADVRNHAVKNVRLTQRGTLTNPDYGSTFIY